MDMELREALEILGPDRVRLGMRAIDDRRTVDVTICQSCFVGEAFGGQTGAYTIGRSDYNYKEASTICEMWYEGWLTPYGIGPRISQQESRAHLRSECIAFLAEHGTAVEPSPATCVA